MLKFKLYLILLLLIFTGYFSNSLTLKNVQILIKGNVYDELTGSPVEANIEFKTKEGKKFKNKSNSIDGRFEQIFNTGEEVELTLINNDVVRKITKIKVKDTIAYSEQKVSITVKKLKVGAKIFKSNIFEKNSDALNNNLSLILDSLRDMFTFNRYVKVTFRINSRDTYAKSVVTEKKINDKKDKKKKKKNDSEPLLETKIIEPDHGLVKTLVDKRINTLNSGLIDLKKFSDKFDIEGDYLPAEPNNNQILNLEIIVKELKNPFE